MRKHIYTYKDEQKEKITTTIVGPPIDSKRDDSNGRDSVALQVKRWKRIE